MKRGQVFVRAQDVSGKWYSADVLDLDDASFRAFVVERLMLAGLVYAISAPASTGRDVTLRSTVLSEEDEPPALKKETEL